MAAPLGHALAGLAVGTAASGGRTILGPWQDLVFFTVVALAPDLDFIPSLITGDNWHQGPSHSLLAAGMMALLCGLWGRGRGHGWLLAWCGGLVYLSHLGVDYLALDTLPPHGLPLWWPFSPEHMTAKHAIFLDVKRHSLTWAVIAHDIKAMAWELVLLGPLAGLAVWFRAWRRGAAPHRG
jgi:inner membrane protein